MNLGQRLRLLRPSASSPVASAEGLETLERSLLGGAAPDLSLKARLERLVAAASRGRGAPAREVVPLEEAVQGLRVTNERGEFFLLEKELPLESYHGEIPLSRCRALSSGAVGVLTGERDLVAFDLAQAVFLDTETTGLAGGTGTAAFLIGIGFADGDRFRVRQYFMRDYHEEAAVLQGLGEELARFTQVVTFNGKMFDIPLLESRYRLNRDRFPLSHALHLDLLHPARRLWKLRLESCRLASLEMSLLGVRRHGDIPGEEIPRIYFDYVRSRDARALARVFHHNHVDIVSLAALAVLACQWVEEGRAEDPRDVYSLARVLERAQLHERSEAEYRRVLASDASPVRVRALMRLASRARRAGDEARALDFWDEAAAEGEPEALRRIAMHHEHRSQDLGAALQAVQSGLALVRDLPDTAAQRAAADFRRRRDRIQRKMRQRRPGRRS